MYTIWIVPGRFGLTFRPQLTGVSTKINLVAFIKVNLVRVWSQLVMWHQRKRQRRHLANLSDDLLKDIGLSRKARQLEVEKKFWK